MLTVLQSIQIDVVEMVIVLSKDYKLFETLKKLLVKLQEPSRVSRINDKLTKFYFNNDFTKSQEHRLNGLAHKEYNKPYLVFNDGEQVWRKYGKMQRNDDLPLSCDVLFRQWRNGDNNSGNNQYNKDDMLYRIQSLYNNGCEMRWKKNARTNGLPLYIKNETRYIHALTPICVFKYLNY